MFQCSWVADISIWKIRTLILPSSNLKHFQLVLVFQNQSLPSFDKSRRLQAARKIAKEDQEEEVMAVTL